MPCDKCTDHSFEVVARLLHDRVQKNKDIEGVSRMVDIDGRYYLVSVEKYKGG